MQEYRYKGNLIIGIDHGYGNMKTAHRVFKSGVDAMDEEPIVSKNYIKFESRYYVIGESHLTYQGDKTKSEDYRILTIAAIAEELGFRQIYDADIILAVGLPLAWAGKQKESFKNYLMEKTNLEFEFKKKKYHVRISDVKVFSQGMAAVMGRDLKGFNMVADIGNGTMNIMQINNERPLEKSLVTEKYGVNQCVKEICRELAKDCGNDFSEELIEPLIRYGVGNRTDDVAKTVMRIATKYTKEIWNKLLDNGYKEGITRLYVVGGGGCLLKHFSDSQEKTGVEFIDDICANAKGYEMIANQLLKYER